ESAPLSKLLAPRSFGFRRERARRDPSEPGPPESLGRRRVLTLEPFDVIAERGRRRQARRSPAGRLEIEREDLAQDDRHAPAVEDQVMERPQQAVALLAEPDQRPAQERRASRIDAAAEVRGEEVRESFGVPR